MKQAQEAALDRRWFDSIDRQKSTKTRNKINKNLFHFFQFQSNKLAYDNAPDGLGYADINSLSFPSYLNPIEIPPICRRPSFGSCFEGMPEERVMSDVSWLDREVRRVRKQAALNASRMQVQVDDDDKEEDEDDDAAAGADNDDDDDAGSKAQPDKDDDAKEGSIRDCDATEIKSFCTSWHDYAYRCDETEQSMNNTIMTASISDLGDQFRVL